MHHPKSGSVSSDDKIIHPDHLKALYGTEVVITEKMDGECTTGYPDGYIHARSLSSSYHPSRTMVKSILSGIAYKIPEGHRICGENLYAKHSIKYTDLSSYFYLFSIWNEHKCLSWDDTEALAADLGLHTVPVLYRGILTASILTELWDGIDTELSEGLVVRSAESIQYDEFNSKVFKIVRPNHVTTESHWMNKEVEPNVIK